MEFDYHSMRAFADSWGLVFMMAFFIGVFLWIVRPGAKQQSDDAARIPFKED
ncbi:MAG: CcoQ/FixQ family Cbb3-type cytochrome c oxidase assembly chaperone [Oricola sp.]